MTKEELIERLGITENQYYGIDVIHEDLYLDDVTSLPYGFNPKVKNDLRLGGLKTIPETFNPVVQCNLHLDNVISIPPNFNPIVGATLYFYKLKSLPDTFYPKVGWDLVLPKVKNIPKNFKAIVFNNLYLPALDSIPDCSNLIIGRDLYFDDDKQFKSIENLNRQPIIWGKYIMFDLAFTEIIQKKGNTYTVKQIHAPEIFYLVTDGFGTWVHGDTIEEANKYLNFKLSKSDLSEFKDLTLDSVLSFDDAKFCYKAISGCHWWLIKDFIKSNNIERKDYTVREIIEIAKKIFGAKNFEKFFNK